MDEFLLFHVVITAITINAEGAERHSKANLFVGELKNGMQIIELGKYIVWFTASELVAFDG